ncbi:hypothetical protein [Brenneria goodwinii]|uniref:hypothetical protein n=1 Tax=Brenneria goodwinii TaxID=1109412 RepID=UPI0036EC5E2F
MKNAGFAYSPVKGRAGVGLKPKGLSSNSFNFYFIFPLLEKVFRIVITGVTSRRGHQYQADIVKNDV